MLCCSNSMFRSLLLRLIHAKISRPNTTTQMAITVNSILAPRVLLNPDSPEGSEDSRKIVARRLHANLNSMGDRRPCRQFLPSPERGTYLQASRSIKKTHPVMCSQQASCESSDYTEHVGRMGTTPQVINVREREGALMKRLVSTLDFRFGCHHSHLNPDYRSPQI